METSARAFHEKVKSQKEVLWALRTGRALTKFEWERMRHPDGSRLAPVIDQLRHCYGFTIGGYGTVEKPYRLRPSDQLPSRVKVTDTIKEAYYASGHWRERRAARLLHDGYRCVLCGESEMPLFAHHVIYNLFEEKLSDLMAVCEACHGKLHRQSRLKFPSGINAEQCRKLGIEAVCANWLFPERLKEAE